jgi:tetratricopeptide (TPR) repeat protein
LNQIRDAAIQSQFSSREALDSWLSRAVGEHYKCLDVALDHTRQALALCPLLGEGYLYLGELSFLEGTQTSAQSDYLRQAIAVRPFHGTVLFHAGKESWLAGNYEEWLSFWQRSFRCGRVYQRQMIDWLAGRTHPDNLDDEIQFFLQAFDPDLYVLRYLCRRYGEIALPEQTVALRLAYGEALEAEAENVQGKEAATRWLEAAAIYSEMGGNERSLLCAQNAFDCDPNSFYARRKLAGCLVENGRSAEAETHLRWCLKRKPDNKTLKNMLMAVVKGQDKQRIRTAQGGESADYLR